MSLGKLNSIIAPVIHGLGYELAGYEEESRGSSTVLRVYINVSGGVTVEDCAKVSRQLSRTLAVMADKAYLLEVSSPGVSEPEKDA